MKKLLPVLFLCCTLFSFAGDGDKNAFSFKLQDNYRLKKTISTDINDQTSLHMAIAKNKDSGNYDLLTFYMDQDGSVTQLETVSFKKQPELVSFHRNGNTLTLTNFEDHILSVDDLDLSGKGHQRKQIKDIDKPKTVFQENNKVLFMKADRRKRTLTMTKVISSQDVEEKKMDVPEKFQDKFRDMFKEDPQVVKTDEFVKNGSISKLQAYVQNGKITMVYDDNDRDENIETFTIDTEKEEPFSLKKYTAPEMRKQKNSNSYLEDNQLFMVNSGKDDVQLNVFDTENGQNKKNFSLQNDLTSALSDTDKRKDFIRDARRGKNKSTVTVNETTDGNMAVRIDYVNTNSYSYNNWWFMWQMQMQLQQQQIQQQMRMLGPSVSNLDLDAMYFKKDEDHSFTIVIDKELNLMQNEKPETKYRDIDKEKYQKEVEEIEKDQKIRHTSIGYLTEEYRYMYSDKKENTLYIQSAPLN